MQRIEVDLGRDGDMKRYVARELNISDAGITMNQDARRKYRQEMLEAKAILVVDFLQARLHGPGFLDVVIFCYDHHFGLEVTGTNLEMFQQFLIEALVAYRYLPRELAITTAHELFPDGRFVRNW